MNYLYKTLFFNIVAGIVQTFIKSWNQLLYPRFLEVCRLPFEPRHDFFLRLIIVVELFTSLLGFRNSSPSWAFTFSVEKSYDGTHLAFGGTLDGRGHFKHVSLKQSRFYHCQMNNAHR